MEERVEQCSACRFYEVSPHHDDEGVKPGFCHRYPPARANEDGMPVKWDYPPVLGDDWCGEFQVMRDDKEMTARLQEMLRWKIKKTER